ncbi:hypothetical protein IMSHALPRED_003148 [Imshaugia aleurites]|uniref:Uncharacterized protein n=1 Tax=Imshaugia aleurites TaxID=172621 RepID=A0A8H3J738_9LECA|nr:hypothetical protein IMSHALPRED_003148 [Imshaugia aleurites]
MPTTPTSGSPTPSTAAPQKATSSKSTNTSRTSVSSSSTPTSTPGAALGLAILTFLATFVIMRRQQRSKGKRRNQSSKDSGGLELNTPQQQQPTPASKTPFVTETSGASGTYENYLPQSADDKTIQQKAKSTLDQIELHVENFYRNSSSSAPRPDNAELAVFDSPYLPAPLTSLLPRSKNKVNIMKHALAQSVTSSISPSASPARSLLPTEYVLLPNTITSARSSVPAKAGSTQIMSRWRVMTAYLRPDPIKDATYINRRDRQINDAVLSFANAFAPWKNTGYKDEERARSLSAILEDAANLGIFLFSQPSTLGFHWPSSSELGPGRIVVSPALEKRSNEKGQELVEAQAMVNMVVLDA